MIYTRYHWVYMSRTTVLSPAALTMGQKVSLLTSVTWPTVTVGPAVSKLDLTVRLLEPLLKPKLLLLLRLTLTLLPIFLEHNLAEEEEEEALLLSHRVVEPTHLGEAQRLRFRAIIAECRESERDMVVVMVDVKKGKKKRGSTECKKTGLPLGFVYPINALAKRGVVLVN